MSPPSFPPPAQAEPPAVPARERESFDVGVFIFNTLVTFLSWGILGAMAYSDWINEDRYWATSMLVALILIVAMLVTFALAHGEGRLKWTDWYGARMMSAVACFGVTTIYAVASRGWANGYRRVFWSLGGLYVGILMEVTTGLFYRLSRALQQNGRTAAQRQRPAQEEGYEAVQLEETRD